MSTDIDVTYVARDVQATLPAAEYIARYRDVERFERLCAACPCYGQRWGCPPFDGDRLAEVDAFSTVTLFACVITPERRDVPLSRVDLVMWPEVERLNARLIELEKAVGGLAMGFTGRCHYCLGEACTRPQGLPCRYPEKVRPSLEAMGFDVDATARGLLGTPLEWSRDPQRLPEHLTLITALFHNNLQPISL